MQISEHGAQGCRCCLLQALWQMPHRDDGDADLDPEASCGIHRHCSVGLRFSAFTDYGALILASVQVHSRHRAQSIRAVRLLAGDRTWSTGSNIQ